MPELVRQIGYISTHSLTRRLTERFIFFNICFQISTHSLTRRLTIEHIPVPTSTIISTHSLTRRLTVLCHVIPVTVCISTHSLTRRLTHCTDPLEVSTVHFNSQPHKEADCCPSLCAQSIFAFQLTASQGG